MNLILLCISAIAFISYVLYVYINYGVLKSISDSYYIIKHKSLFTFFIWGLTIPMLFFSSGHGLLFFGAAFICVVGIASGFKETMEGRVHVFFTNAGILLSYLSLWFDYHMWYLVVLFLLFTIPSFIIKYKNHTWWIEVVAFTLVLIGLIKSIL